MVFLRVLATACIMTAAAACATYEAPPYDGETISVSYDPYDYDPDDLQAEADAHCRAYGLSAVFDGETANPQEVRWRYRHYRCV